MIRNTVRGLRSLHTDWTSVYERNGGIGAFRKCLSGTLNLRYGLPGTETNGDLSKPFVDCITFSILPQLTALWAIFVEEAIAATPKRLIVGDCSGSFLPLSTSTQVQAIPLLNHAHGVKLDLFMNRVCTADYVIVSDDDIFWLNSTPWQWACEQLQGAPNVAVVSLFPRKNPSSVLRETVEQGMGSYCLVIRRDVWLSEGLSFQIDYSPLSEGYDWFYDTADLANVQLIRRGYEIAIAPPDIQNHLISFIATSGWVLKIRKSDGEILDSINSDLNYRPMAALRTVILVRGLTELIREFWPKEPLQPILAAEQLNRAQAICERLIDPSTVDHIQSNIDGKVAALKQRLTETRVTELPDSAL